MSGMPGLAQRMNRGLHDASERVAATPFGRPVVHAPLVFGLLLVAYAVQGPGSFATYTILTILIYGIAVLGLNIPAGFGGALSLGQGASFAVGAYTVGALTVDNGWPFWATLPVAALVGLVFGLVLGAPAGRLGEIGLALISLGAVLITLDLIVALDGITGGVTGLSPIGLITGFGAEPTYSLWLLPVLVTASALVAYLLHYAVRVSLIGRSAMATRDEPIGATALGISGYRSKVVTFTLGSGFGAYAGGLFAYMAQYISPDAFTAHLSILLLAMVILGGAGSIYGPLLGAVILVLLPQALAAYAHVNTIIYGATLMAVVLLRPSGLISRTAAPVRDRLRASADDPSGAEEREKPEPAAAAERIRNAGPDAGLQVRGISRSFGGLKALDSVSLGVRPGEVLALIGPNGSGKTTVINVVTGLYPAEEGRIVLDSEDITRLKARRITELGVARTFQTPKTFPGLSVAEHLFLAKRLQPPGQVVGEDLDPWVRRLLKLGGIDPDDPRMMARETGQLGHGQLRFLEIAMAIRHSPRLLLLDEPAAGLSQIEMQGLEQVTRELADLGIAVIVVEHHLDLVTRLADRVVVLELGKVLWEGRPDELMDAEAVRVAYLGGAG
ncbi:branched-chain amino acid ABC transporter ATP-binding protein/permease [Nonomuraea harbinensis]|uniref:ATP-binding cassette domain-containing protein n=1 Tax=Nonomuraea harbinensis TaxID=1286938 RepID=A0ABW1C9S3_9ACTN|nr:branched-chain amino acid ABC transporter ATP-binding protein/permease [Nonomuraea harbinensis]